jgi:hypothetical protein
MGDDTSVDFGKKFHGGKGSLRQCVFLMQQRVLSLPKFGAKSSRIFTQST